MIGIDTSSSIPPFQQVRECVQRDVRAGTLVPGSKLPTVRALAEQLGLAVNTVARAYRELEKDGFIQTRGRHGSFIAAQGDGAQREAQVAALAYAERVVHLGVPCDEALKIVESALNVVAPGSDPSIRDS